TLALTLQPDAAQLTAYSVAILTSLLTSKVSRLPRSLAAAIPVLLLLCLAIAWRIPDPLAPVPYVEGVFTIAATTSPIVLCAALAFAAMPVAGFVWLARAHRYPANLPLATLPLATLPTAAYYATLFALAPLQITPVPLLGYGAGPILGYFLATTALRQPPHQSTPPLPTKP
ncbi:hypothetical protein WDZ92_18835, partial [Nostoc sp. NIES-2111]